MTAVIQASGFLLFTKSDPCTFLLLKHKNRWDLPKGHAEEGETLLQTALRETEEETGIAADNISVDPKFQFVLEYPVTKKKRGDYQKRVTYFLGYLPTQCSLTLTEHIGFEWFRWPTQGSIQSKTIDPLLTAVREHLEEYPERLAVS